LTQELLNHVFTLKLLVWLTLSLLLGSLELDVDVGRLQLSLEVLDRDQKVLQSALHYFVIWVS